METRWNWNRVERLVGGLKFSVALMSLLTITMIVGTFVESWHGPDYANRLIYKSPFFIGILFFLFLSILLATFTRLSLKKRPYGFFTVHLGLLLICAGSFITYYAGVDGNISLEPNTPSRDLILNSDVLYITFHNSKREITYELPYSAFPSNINEDFAGIRLKRFLPFSKSELRWVTPANLYDANTMASHSSTYSITGKHVAQKFTLSLHPDAKDFQASRALGPLNAHYVPEGLLLCFAEKSLSGLILWDSKSDKCFTTEAKEIRIEKTKSNNRFFVLKDGSEFYTFFPDFVPWPIDKEKRPIQGARYRVLNKKIFEKSPNLFLFGKGASYFKDDQWHTVGMSEGESISLPWMDMKLTLEKYTREKIPTRFPISVVPTQKNGRVVVGAEKALLVNFAAVDYWVKGDRSLDLLIKGEKVTLALGPKRYILPYQINLKQFEMERNPGTNVPASFESFVDVFDGGGYQSHHIFMNNPMKYSGFTFYQSSYFQTSNNGHGSVLSVNFDPGRAIKYLGALLVVLGAILHYFLTAPVSGGGGREVQL